MPGPRGRTVTSIGAGTFGARDPALRYPWQYNLLTVDERGILVQTRSKVNEGGVWAPDARWISKDGEAPKAEYRVRFKTPMLRRDQGEPAVPASGEPQTIGQLKKRLQRLEYQAEGYRIAVEALIFNADGKLLLQTRGQASRDEVGKLEGVGGDLKGGHDLHAALRSNIAKKVGSEVKVSIDDLLEVRPVRFVERGHDPQDWIVVSYLCRLLSGDPTIVDPERTERLDSYTLTEIFNMDDDLLSRSTSRARDLYRIKYRDRPYFRNR